MSIYTIVKAAVKEGRLAYLPLLTDGPARRPMLIAKEVQDLLTGPFSDDDHERRVFSLRADLETFVIGNEISMGLTPRKHRQAQFGRLDPIAEGNWDVRSRAPKPGLRVLGRFLAPDTFVALTWAPRSRAVPWSTRLPLAGDDQRWRDLMDEAEQSWVEALPGCNPLVGNEVHDYVRYHPPIV